MSSKPAKRRPSRRTPRSALANAPRNMTDEMIQALAKKGGVVQINFNCGFLSQKTIDAAKGQPANTKPLPAQLSDVVAHIDRVVKIAGIDSVGIGSDFDGVGCTPEG